MRIVKPAAIIGLAEGKRFGNGMRADAASEYRRVTDAVRLADELDDKVEVATGKPGVSGPAFLAFLPAADELTATALI